MSIINDALRRASNASSAEIPPLPPAPAYAAPAAAMDPLPAPDETPKQSRSGVIILILAIILLGVGATAGLLLWQQSHGAKKVAQAPRSSGPAQALIPAADRIARIAAIRSNQVAEASVPMTATPASNPAAAPARNAASAATPAPAPPAAASAPAPQVPFPQLRLQGIYYRKDNPSVMLNNRQYYLGDQVQGVTVAAIDESSVTLVLSGRTNVLTLR